MYDNLIIQLDKKEQTDTHTGFTIYVCQHTVSQAKGCRCVSTHGQSAKWERKREKARVYVYEQESVTVLPKSPQRDSRFKQPQTAGDQIQSGAASCFSWHDGFTECGNKRRAVTPKMHSSRPNMAVVTELSWSRLSGLSHFQSGH